MPQPSNPYSPTPGSLAANVGAYLKTAGIGAILTTADVARRFQVPTSSVQASLDSAVRANFLRRQVESGSAHYAAGKLLLDWQPRQEQATHQAAAAPAAQAGSPAATPAAATAPEGGRKRCNARLEDLPDPSSLVIRTDVPLPQPRSAMNVTAAFEPRFLELQVGQSFEVPAEHRKTFQRMGVELGRKHGRYFACRLQANGVPAVWRLEDDTPVLGRPRTGNGGKAAGKSAKKSAGSKG